MVFVWVFFFFSPCLALQISFVRICQKRPQREKSHTMLKRLQTLDKVLGIFAGDLGMTLSLPCLLHRVKPNKA